MTRLAAPCVDAVVEALRLRGSLKKAYRDIYMFSEHGIFLDVFPFLFLQLLTIEAKVAVNCHLSQL